MGNVRPHRLGGGAAECGGAAHCRAGIPPGCGNLPPQTASCIQQPWRLPVPARRQQPLQPGIEPLRGFLQASRNDQHLALGESGRLLVAQGRTHHLQATPQTLIRDLDAAFFQSRALVSLDGRAFIAAR